jgi:hypothetical protein
MGFFPQETTLRFGDGNDDDDDRNGGMCNSMVLPTFKSDGFPNDICVKENKKKNKQSKNKKKQKNPCLLPSWLPSAFFWGVAYIPDWKKLGKRKKETTNKQNKTNKTNKP